MLLSIVSKDLYEYGTCQNCNSSRKAGDFCCNEIVRNNYQLMVDKLLKKKGVGSLKIHEVYKDFSDEFRQDRESFGYFLKKDKAIEKLGDILVERESLSDEEILAAKKEGHYNLDYVGFYSVDEIDVIE